ncbi:endo-1,4-beta-xylanase [Candidatus Uhrbacteria bacterium]|nr:endo-1,4-beta-xylanase [Candidatus Uhrbacteria bacterium]
MKHPITRSILALLFFFLVLIFAGLPNFKANHPITWGLNFSQPQAEYLGLDWRQVYQATLKDLNSKNYRLSAYWNRVEAQKDKFDFSELDFMLSQARQNNAQILMAVGGKLPRWPECHFPDWTKSLGQQQLEERLMFQLANVVQHLKQYGNIAAWQVENEPFLDFGVCPKFSEGFLAKEIALVRKLDPRQILVTEPGELSTWFNASKFADIVGISLYRTVWNSLLGVVRYPLTPAFYNLHAKFVKRPVIITELQAEPWSSTPIRDQSLEQQRQTFDLNRFNKNINFVKETDFSRAYIWGAEYWYYLKMLGDNSIWLRAKSLFSAGN